MSLTALFKRLRALENRPSRQKPLRIVGGLPSGSDMVQSMASTARTAPPPGNAIDHAVRRCAATPKANSGAQALGGRLCSNQETD
jgi:hypothetical protein